MKVYKPFDDEKVNEVSKKINGFFSTHNHTEISNFRLRDCIIRVPELINTAISLGYNGVCCTDHEALSAHVRLMKHYKKLKSLYQKYISQTEEENKKDKEIQSNLNQLQNFKEDFKIGLGNEIYLIDNLEDVTENYISGETKYYHFILIAKDEKGYEQLKRISSESAWENWFKQRGMERVPTIKKELEKIIGEEKGHLISQNACLGGELDYLILKYLETENKIYKRKIHNFITWCIDIFGKENFFLEIQPCIIKYDENKKPINHPQAMVNQFIFTLAKAYDLNVVCSTDSHYALLKDRKVHEAYLKADDEEKSKNREVGDFYETTYMFDIKELIKTLSYHLTEDEIIKALNGTMEVYNKIEEIQLEHSTIVPRDKKIPPFKLRHTLKEYYEKYEYIKKFAESNDIQDQYLLYLVENGLDKLNQWGESKFHFVTYNREGEILSENDKIITQEEKIARLDEEFSSFWKISEKLNQKLSAYYVLVRGLVQEVIWKVSYLGPGRGSAGGSYICYLIEITQINPLKYNLPFWRHSSPLRPELPDLKIAFLNIKLIIRRYYDRN